MGTEKAIYQDDPFDDGDEIAFEIELPMEDGYEYDDEFEEVDIPHDANLAEEIDSLALSRMGSKLIRDYEADRRTRSEWEDSYTEGLELLGLKTEERSMPFEGACGVHHPLLIEAVIKFQAQSITSTFPAAGPVKTKIVGETDTERTKQATRVESEMNYQLTENMSEYRNEMEQLLFRLPLSGSAFKKTYYDTIKERPVSIFVPAEDFVVQYGESNLEDCSRYTHVLKKSSNEIRKLQVSGFYRDIAIGEAAYDYTEIEQSHDELVGVSSSTEDENRHTLLEMHLDLELPDEFEDPDGIARPHIVTIDLSSQKVLSIYRNWDEEDELKQKKEYFTHFLYLPGLGFYGIGLIHLIGGLAEAATSLTRQLVDAGTFANLPGGLKAKGFRVKNDDQPIEPGEWRDVDIGGGNIRDSLFPLPYKEPSNVLFQLLTNVVEEGRRIGSIADINIAQLSGEAPVGTTLALLERNLKVLSAVQARIHAGLAKEFKLISEIISDFMPPDYDYEVKGEFRRVDDFDGRIDIIPVSDPNASTMAQKVVQYQAALQLAQGAPQIYNIAALHRGMIEALNIPNPEDIIPLPDEIKPMDPISENMAILKQEQTKAFYYQDHEAHIKAHMAAASDPKIKELVGQSPFASVIQSTMAAHITEHVAYQYRKDIEEELGVPLPDPETPLPEDVEFEMSKAVASAASKLLQKNTAEMAAQELKKEKEDPLNQMQHRELAVKEGELQLKTKDFELKAQIETKKQELELLKHALELEMRNKQIESQERQTGLQVGSKIATDKDRNDTEQLRTVLSTAAQIETAKMNKNSGDSE